MKIEVINHEVKIPYVVEKLISRKCHKLEQMLKNHKTQTLVIKCDLDAAKGKKAFNLKLTLQIPNATLHATETGPSIMNVFGAGFKKLFYSVSKLKESLRTGREAEQKRKNAENSIADSALTHSGRNKLAEFYSGNYGRFYNYALREIRFRSYQGYTKPGIIDVNDVLDEALLSVAKKLNRDYNEAKARRLFYNGIKKVIDKLLNPSGIGLIPIENRIEPEDIDAAYQEYYQPDEIIKVEDILIDPDSIPAERHVEYMEIEMHIDKLLAQLPADWREIFILFAREDLSIAAIAKNKGKSVEEIRTILKNAKNFIREKLIDAGFHWKH